MLALTERYAPSLLGVAAATLGWFALPTWLRKAPVAGLDLSEVFGATFDTATFAAGLLFTIYILILAPSGTFVEKLFGTKTFALFHRYVTLGILSSVFLSVFTIYYLIAGLPDAGRMSERAIATLWLGMTAYAFGAVLRVMLVFLTLVGVQAKARKRPGLPASL